MMSISCSKYHGCYLMDLLISLNSNLIFKLCSDWYVENVQQMMLSSYIEILQWLFTPSK